MIGSWGWENLPLDTTTSLESGLSYLAHVVPLHILILYVLDSLCWGVAHTHTESKSGELYVSSRYSRLHQLCSIEDRPVQIQNIPRSLPLISIVRNWGLSEIGRLASSLSNVILKLSHLHNYLLF